MALFTITRYTGESEADREKESKSDLLLSRLNERALKRKQESASKFEEKDDSKNLKSKESGGSKPPKKKKKISLPDSADKISLEGKSKSSSIVEECETRDEIVKNVLKKEITENGISSQEGDSDIDEIEDDEQQDSQMEVPESDQEPKSEEPKSFTVLGEVWKKTKQKVERVLPQWLAHPSVVEADIRRNTSPLSDVGGIDEHLTQRLRDSGIHSYFPVQAQVIPALLSGMRTGFLTGRAGYRPCDICCSAPTGSGKTLAYVLPIVQTLKPRVTCQVRALVVLPVRELATQVFKVFQTFCEGTSLKVGCVVGVKSFQREQTSLLRRSSVTGEYQSTVDIVVATPGRLVDHINNTQGFSLSHLRYLVIDEADRMMDEIKQDWLAEVEGCVFSQRGGRVPPGPLTAAHAARADIPLQKLLFSATLSQNPEKLEQLGLFQPKLFTSVVEGGGTQGGIITGEVRREKTEPSTEEGDTQGQDTEEQMNASQEENTSLSLTTPVKGDFIGKYTTPSGLTELFCPCTPSQKPLAILYFLHQLKFRNVLCFTNSVEVTHRLYWLIKLVGGIEVKEFSSKQHAQKRAKLLNQFKAGKIQVLVCSDAMARGMDISNVRYVISYETPPFLKTYIHRVGRTARAGHVGTAITLLQNKEVFHFKKMIREAGKTSVKEMRLSKADLKPYVESLEESLKQLPDILKSEKMKK